MSKEIKRMTYKERVKWHEEHLEEIFLAHWNDEIFIYYPIVSSESCEYMKDIVQHCKMGVEIGVNRFLRYKPHYEQNLHKEEWLGCDLTLVHELLRRNNFE